MDANDATKDSSRYKLLLKVPYQLKDGEVKIKVSGNVHDLCPEDGCTVVLQRHLEHIQDKYLNWDPHGYVFIKYQDEDGNPKKTYLHRYFMFQVENKVIPPKHVVHHKDHYRFNNSFTNLEVTTYGHNNAAVIKSENASSSYPGVGKHKASGKWTSKICVDKTRVHLGLFEQEVDAAKAYETSFIAVHGKVSGTKGLLSDEEVLTILANREKYVPTAKRASRELPKHMTCARGIYVVKFSGEGIYQRFNDFDSASEFLEQCHKECDDKKRRDLLSQSIQRNDEGCAIIPVRILKTSDYVYAIVDDDMYYSFVQHKWFLSAQGYPQTDNVLMHTLVHPNNDPNKQIDHTTINKLDNRRENLRHISRSAQDRNKRKKEGCSSSYIGVRKSGRRWRAYITHQHRTRDLGTYVTEEEAASVSKSARQKLDDDEESSSV
jgi:hypothetical protein